MDTLHRTTVDRHRSLVFTLVVPILVATAVEVVLDHLRGGQGFFDDAGRITLYGVLYALLLGALACGIYAGERRHRADAQRRIDSLRRLLTVEPQPHVSDIYEILGESDPHEQEFEEKRLAQIRAVTGRFVSGFIGAREYDRYLRDFLSIPGRGEPRR